MNTLERILRDHGFGERYATPTVKKVLLYLFRRSNLKSLRRALPKEVKFKLLTQKLTNDGYIIKNLKLWLYWCAKNGGATSKTVAQQFKIRDCDLGLAKLVHSVLPQITRRMPAMTPDQLDRYVLWADEQANAWMGKFVNRKMKFLQNSYGKRFHALMSDLRHAGIRCIYLMYPRFDSAQHMLNCYKRSVHNAGINLIQSSTAKKRSELTRTEHGFFLTRTLSTASGFLPDGQTSVMVTEPVNIDLDRFFRNCSDRQRECLQVLGGEASVDFRAWLKKSALAKTHQTDFDKMTVEEKSSLYAAYAAVPVRKVHSFVARARTVLASL